MIVLAHILGVPVEELMMPWATGAGTAMLLVLASSIGGLTSFTTRRRR